MRVLESIIYIITVGFLLFSFLKFKKSEKKLNLIHWIFISLMLLFCYNSLLVLILSTFSIPSYLFILSICNCLVSLFLLFNTKKKYQEYYLEKKDIISSIILFVITIIIMIIRFGIPFSISYETCDPGIHFWTSKDFYEQSYLLNKVTDKTVVNFETRQTASYTNMGLIFKTVSPFINEFNLYIVYIIFDLFMLFLAGMLFYILISNTKNKTLYLISVLASILYFIGYPLNNMIFGFFYSGHAITITILIYIFMKYYLDKEFSYKILLFLLSLSCFGLFFSYYFYAPVVFLGIFIYILYMTIRNNKKVFSLDYILKNVIIFLPACLFGFLYYIVPNLGNVETSITTQINLDGYFYNNIYSNFILLVPIVIISFIYFIRNKKLSMEHFMLILLLIFMGVILVFMLQGSAVGYYLSKNYYLLWLLMFILSFKFVIEIFEKYKLILTVYLVFILGIILLTIFNVESKIIALEDWSSNKTSPSNIFDVYRYNLEIMLYEPAEFTSEEIEMLYTIYNMGVEDLQHNAFYSYLNRRAWLAAFFRKTPITQTTENRLFTYLVTSDWIELIAEERSKFDYNPDDVNFYEINSSNYHYFLLFYEKEVDNPVLEEGQEQGAVIEGKENYDLIDRTKCINCTFYDFDTGVLIYKP